MDNLMGYNFIRRIPSDVPKRLSIIHDIYWKVSKEGDVFFHNELNTFCLWLYDVWHVVKNYSDSERGKTLVQLHGLLIPISNRGSWNTGWKENIKQN